MKIVDKNKAEMERVKKKQINKDKSKKEHVSIVAQEIKFARLLSGNEKKTRDRVLKTLKKWLLNCFQKGYVFKEDDFTRVWKGLFYAVWMSDKLLIQEELCDGIAGILDLFPPEKIRYAVLMIKAGFKILATEWFGIDQHRFDKFLMLVRRYLRGSLRCLLRCQWSMDSCQLFANMLSSGDGIFALKTPHYARNAISMILHIIDCYLEELAKVSRGDIPAESLVEVLRPICRYTCVGEVSVLCAAGQRLLTALLRQSEPGLRYQDATEAWKRMGCPAGGPEALEPVSDDEDDVQENSDDDTKDDEISVSTALDPRAGRVDVALPLLPVPAALLASMLRDMLARTTSKAHKRVKLCAQRFERLSEGEYPLSIRYEQTETRPPARGSLRRNARALRALEEQLRSDADELKLRGLSRKHRKRLLKKTRAGLSIVDDVGNLKQSLSNSSVNDDWKIETAEPEAKKPKEDTSNKENQHKNKKNKNHDKKNKIKKRKIETVVQNENTSNKRQKADATDKRDKITEITDKKEKTNNKIKATNKKHITKDLKEGIKNKENDVKGNKEKTFLATNNDNVKNEVETKKLQKNLNLAKSQKTMRKSHVEKPINITKPKETKVNKNSKPLLIVNKVKKFQKLIKKDKPKEPSQFDSPKKVKFVLKNNSMQGPVDYYKSVRQSPNIPFDSSKQPSKTNLKPSTPSPINPFFKKMKFMK